MLPLRLVFVRHGRVGVWSLMRFNSSKEDGGKLTEGESDEPSGIPQHEPRRAEDKHASAHKTSEQSRAASFKLNELLHSMLKEETTSSTSSKAETVTLSRPKQRKKLNKEPEPDTKPPVKMLGVSMVHAVKQVAHELGGDKQQTQSQLLGQLIETTVQSSSVPGMNQVPSMSTKAPINLSDLIVGMKIDRSKPAPPDMNRSHEVRRILMSQQPVSASVGRTPRGEPSVSASMMSRQSRQQQHEVASPAGLNEGVPLSIFSPGVASNTSEDTAHTWNSLHQRELLLAVTHPPANIFEEMILWTNQGKLWHFPINNEQGLEKEAEVPFTKHVFLEQHIEPWCPKRGPIRHFMELVCVGLSKNPYMTVEAKKGHIDWYKNYFNSKQDVLKEVGAIS